MNSNLYEVLEIEDKLKIYLSENADLEIEKEVKKLDKILKKLDNKDILNLFNKVNYIHEVVDLSSYLKKYKIDKKELKITKEYKNEFRKLSKFVSLISENSIDENEYMNICLKCDVDNVSEYLFRNMTNQDIYDLSKETDDWNYKLFFFDKFKY